MNKSKKTNKLMWIIRNNETGEFLHKDRRYDYTRKLQNALLMPSRRVAVTLRKRVSLFIRLAWVRVVFN